MLAASPFACESPESLAAQGALDRRWCWLIGGHGAAKGQEFAMTTLLMLIFLLIAMAGGAILGWLAHARHLGIDDAEPVEGNAQRFGESPREAGD